MKKNNILPLFTRNLLYWNEMYNNRAMPWKGEKDPYKIWLSEIILQQTRVDQGWQYYERFIRKYPSIQHLAAAPEQEVFKLWEGLGYYSRCRNLLAAARTIVVSHAGKFPNNYKEILQLKGVGPYTAAAISSFAFDEARAVVDGNVSRVLSRYFGIDAAIDSTAGKKLFAEKAMQLLDHADPGSYNQAIMDFGATVCKPRQPLCLSCPLNQQCVAYLTDRVLSLPVKEKFLVKKKRSLFYVVVEGKAGLMIRKRKEKDIWEGLHEFMLIETPHGTLMEEMMLTDSFHSIAGKDYQLLDVSPVYRQQLTHQSIYAQFIRIRTKKSSCADDVIFVPKQNISGYAFPVVINRYLSATGLL